MELLTNYEMESYKLNVQIHLELHLKFGFESIHLIEEYLESVRISTYKSRWIFLTICVRRFVKKLITMRRLLRRDS